MAGSKSDMIPFQTALDMVLTRVKRMETETVPLAQARGRVLAEDVHSDMDFPPFNKSAMDGFACRRADLHGDLEIIETIAAGAPPAHAVGKNQCARIMTGAMVPVGADVVFMVEYAELLDRDRVRFTQEETRDNICLEAEDVHIGDLVLGKGVVIRAQHIAVLASVGCTEITVARQPLVGIIATGDELVEPGVKPGLSQIRNSNSHQLVAQVEEAAAVPVYYGIAGDAEGEIEKAIRRAVAECDVILLSGGVSMGDFDFVPQVLRNNGFTILFDRVCIKPGKPATFAVSDGACCFGLPGNPVSTFVIFELLARPGLRRMMGVKEPPPDAKIPLDEDIRRHKADREELVPVRITESGGVAPISYHGSAHFIALARCNGLARIPAGVAVVEKGTRIRVRFI